MYRLNDTWSKDEKQCIRFLSIKDNVLRTKLMDTNDISVLKEKPYPLVYVPQFWGVIVGLGDFVFLRFLNGLIDVCVDTLVTSGPISEPELESSSILTNKIIPTATKGSLALVRIQLEHHGEREDLIYPLRQCDSWFVCI